jgi:glutaredoxin 3
MIEIYGKTNCPQCEEVKTMLDMNSMDYKYYTLDVDFSRDELLEHFPSARTFPQIKDNGNVIGGINEFNNYFEQTHSGSTEGKL